MSENTVNDKAAMKNNGVAEEGATHPRLPCRGCTVDCKNFNYCDGLLWRMDSYSAQPK